MYLIFGFLNLDKVLLFSVSITTTKQHATHHNGIVLKKVEKDETMAKDDRTNCPLSTETVVQERRHISVENFELTRDFSSFFQEWTGR